VVRSERKKYSLLASALSGRVNVRRKTARQHNCEDQCRISVALQEKRDDRRADQNQNNGALKLGDEKRDRSGAPLTADSVFPNFGEASLGFCAC